MAKVTLKFPSTYRIAGRVFRRGETVSVPDAHVTQFRNEHFEIEVEEKPTPRRSEGGVKVVRRGGRGRGKTAETSVAETPAETPSTEPAEAEKEAPAPAPETPASTPSPEPSPTTKD